MEKSVILRLILLGFLSFTQCEEERVFRIQADMNPVYRNAFHAERDTARLQCIPPLESSSDKERYSGVAIYWSNGTKESEKPVCEYSKQSPSCQFRSAPEPSLFTDATKAGIYTCRYDVKKEPEVKSEFVHIYFKEGGNMRVFDENDRLIPSTSLQITNGSSFRLLCPDAGETGAKVHWYRNGHELKLDHGNAYYEYNTTNHNLTFKAVKNPDASKFGGWYRCETLSKDGVRLNTAFVKINNNAYISAASKSYNKMEGESATLSCEVEGEPIPAVSWKRGDTVLGSEEDHRKRMTFSSFKGIPNASITIKDLVAEDYGDYHCVADGADGSHAEAVILLRVRSKLAALWPFLGIVAEVIVLVAIIFIYEKRRAKKEREENEDAADQKKSLTASNNENKDVRQRKA